MNRDDWIAIAVMLALAVGTTYLIYRMGSGSALGAHPLVDRAFEEGAGDGGE